MPYKDKNKQRRYQKEWKARNSDKTKRRHSRYKKEYEDFMAQQKCSFCSESHMACLCWHHINPESKKYEISSKKARAPLSTLLKEIKKCLCLCENCHRKLHYELIGKNK